MTTIQKAQVGVSSPWFDTSSNRGSEAAAALAVWAAAAREAAPARLAALAAQCREEGPMLTRQALDSAAPGIDVVIEAASWGRWQVVRAVAGAGGDIGAVWECPVTGGLVNVLGLVLVRFSDLCGLALMSQELRADFLMTLAEVGDAAGLVARVGDVPPVLAGPLLEDFEEATGQRLRVIWGDGV